jgi:hypothetical protein
MFQNGDIGLIYSPGIISWLENLYANKYKEGNIKASHGFFFKDENLLSEAEGFSIHEVSRFKYFHEDPNIKTWIFRYSHLTSEQLGLMNTYVTASENGDARYSWSGIWSFAESYFNGKRTFVDPSGEFCTDYTGQIISAAQLPYITALKPWEIDPTTQLNYFLSDQAKQDGWIQVYQ